MESVDLEVLNTSARWLAEGHRVPMATVVRTWGSSPRPEGALLAIRGDGLVALRTPALYVGALGSRRKSDTH